MFNIFLSINPSIAFLWAILADALYYLRISETDRAFDSIIKEVEEEMEEDDIAISVAFMEDKAYWVVNNTFYQADIVNGEIDKESSRPVDASNMSYRDMTKMLFILDHLNEG